MAHVLWESNRLMWALERRTKGGRLKGDVARRKAEHNAGSGIHTAKYRPWIVGVVIEFPEEQRAAAFERYLKSGSSVAFAQRHLR